MPLVEHRYRRNTAAQWLALDPILGPGEPGMEIDTRKFKLGDGYTKWAELPYFTPDDGTGSSDAAVNAHIHAEEPHPVYDDGPDLMLLYQNAKV